MIVKIDHVSFSCPPDFNYIKEIPPGYKVEFTEMNLKNIPCKSSFLYNRQDAHNIIFLNYEDFVPIEITQYKTCTLAETNIKLQDRTFCLFVEDINESQALFENLGFSATQKRSHGVEMEIKPILDKYTFRIRLLAAEVSSGMYLDNIGFSSIGLFVDNIIKEVNKIKAKGYEVTTINELNVNGRMLDIAFMRGTNGEIIEIIGLKQEPRK